MNLDILLSSSPPIPLHALAAIAAIVIGGIQFATEKGTLVHRSFGYVWMALMAVVCVSSFFIHGFNVLWGYSPIHLLSVLTLVALCLALVRARQGRVRAHRLWVINTYFFSLILAGAFTFLPGRVMYRVVFG